MRHIVPIAMLLAAASCACAQDLTTTAAYKAACGSPDEKWSVSVNRDASATTPSADTNFYLIQNENVSGGACLSIHSNCGALVRFGVDGHWVAASHGLSYIALPVAPGNHHLCVDWQSHSKRLSHDAVSLNEVNVAAGHTYYWSVQVLAVTNDYGGSYALTLAPVNDDEAHMLMQAAPQSVSKKDR